MSIIFLFLVSFPLVAFGAESSSARVSLEDAKRYAVEHNFEVSALKRSVEEAQAGRQLARSSYYPRIGIAGGFDNQVSSLGNQAAPVGYLYGNFNLFRGFADKYRSDMADIEENHARVRLKKATFRIGLEVEQQFHLYLFKNSSIEQREKALKENETHKKMANQRKAGGFASESDVMEFDLRDSLLRSELAVLGLEMERSRVNLRRLLGEEIGGQIEPVGTLAHYRIKGSLQDYIKRISTENDVVISTSRELAKAIVDGKIARSNWLPQLDIETQVGYLRIQDRPDWGGTNLGGGSHRGLVLAKIDLFSGFETIAKQGQAEAKRLRLEAELKQKILDAASQLEVSYRTLKAIESQIKLEELNNDRAERYYKSILAEYKRGVKNSSDVKNASEGLFQAAVRHESHKYEFLVEKANMESLLGGPIEVEALSLH